MGKKGFTRQKHTKTTPYTRLLAYQKPKSIFENII